MNYLKSFFKKKPIVEEEKKQMSLTPRELQQYREKFISGKRSLIEIIDSARLGVYDYDFNSIKQITDGKQGVAYTIKSLIDGKTYVAKQLQGLKISND